MIGSQEIIEITESEREETLPSWQNNVDVSSMKEGYDLERFIETPRRDFQCPICLSVVRIPLECSQCGVLLCKKCALSCGRSQNPFLSLSSSMPKFNCPICRSQAPPREPSAILKNIINGLMVYCKNVSHGCSKTSALGEIKAHEKECKFKAIRCANHNFCDKQGNKVDFIVVEFPKLRGNPSKSKLVCSEICKKVVLMDFMLKSDQYENAINEYRIAIETLDKIKESENVFIIA